MYQASFGFFFVIFVFVVLLIIHCIKARPFEEIGMIIIVARWKIDQQKKLQHRSNSHQFRSERNQQNIQSFVTLTIQHEKKNCG